MRGVVFLGALVLAGAVVVGSGAARPDGAAEGTAKSGCTCHGAAATKVSLQLTAPAEYEVGKSYNLTLTIAGAADSLPVVGSNKGGFAFEASDGTTQPGDATKMQLKGKLLTHTTAGNDQRSWAFTWTAPATPVPKVTFFYAGNGVNGDGTSAGDEWNKATKEVPLRAAANQSTPPANATKGDGSPGVGPLSSVAAASAGLVALAVLRRRL